MTFRGAFVTTINSGNQNLQNNIHAFLSYGTVEYDTEGFFDTNNPNKFTIPAGITKVRLLSQAVFMSNTSGMRQIVIKKNYVPGGGWYPGVPASTVPSNLATTTDVAVFTPVIEVEEGDIFQVEAYQSSGGVLPVLASVGTWFAIEVVE